MLIHSRKFFVVMATSVGLSEFDNVLFLTNIIPKHLLKYFETYFPKSKNNCENQWYVDSFASMFEPRHGPFVISVHFLFLKNSTSLVPIVQVLSTVYIFSQVNEKPLKKLSGSSFYRVRYFNKVRSYFQYCKQSTVHRKVE